MKQIFDNFLIKKKPFSNQNNYERFFITTDKGVLTFEI